MIFYLIFNGSLYLMQLLLYAALFLYDKNGIFKDEKQDRLNLVRAGLDGLMLVGFVGSVCVCVF